MGWELLIYAIIMIVVSYVVSALMMPKPVQQKPATIEEFDFPQVDDGTPQCVVFGDCWIPDWLVLWYGKYRIHSM